MLLKCNGMLFFDSVKFNKRLKELHVKSCQNIVHKKWNQVFSTNKKKVLRFGDAQNPVSFKVVLIFHFIIFFFSKLFLHKITMDVKWFLKNTLHKIVQKWGKKQKRDCFKYLNTWKMLKKKKKTLHKK